MDFWRVGRVDLCCFLFSVLEGCNRGNVEKAAHTTYYGMVGLQHRGQEGAGLVSCNVNEAGVAIAFGRRGGADDETAKRVPASSRAWARHRRLHARRRRQPRRHQRHRTHKILHCGRENSAGRLPGPLRLHPFPFPLPQSSSLHQPPSPLLPILSPEFDAAVLRALPHGESSACAQRKPVQRDGAASLLREPGGLDPVNR
eukprot:754319-Hanusia_phi.AAC.1